MKNIIFVTIDAFCKKNLDLKVGNKMVTPFLNDLKNKSIYFNQMYSQAPYTEASMVNILGGEKTLDSGGYLFGNGNVGNTLFSHYKKVGFKTLSTYSPYVYSKAYIREVDEFYYSRLYSVQALFDYRFYWYRDKIKDKNKLDRDEYDVCKILLEEAFETWMLQCRKLLQKDKETKLIIDNVEAFENIKYVYKCLNKEKEEYVKNENGYIDSVLKKWKKHNLWQLDVLYNKRKKLPLLDWLKEEYQEKLTVCQKRYYKVIKRQSIDWKYIIKKAFNTGIVDCIKLVRRYYMYVSNNYLGSYFDQLDENSKIEVSMDKMFKEFSKEIIDNDKMEKSCFSYIHVQDFHLPSVFHSVDSTDVDSLKEEFEVVFELLDGEKMDIQGNIIAALSARYCDFKLQKFFEELKQELKNDFIFVVTADHGYPCYEMPPREKIYNQTYTEAFHIPMIIYNSENEREERINKITTNIDGINKLKFMTNVVERYPKYKKDYVLIEYAGPGCPTINEKKIWYTIIDKTYRISAQCMLNKKFEYNDIVAIYNLEEDPEEKYNLVKKISKIQEIKKYHSIFASRHKYLAKYSENFYKKMIHGLKE